MTNSEIKQWAKEKIKGKWLSILPAIFVASLLTGLTLGKVLWEAMEKCLRE